MLSLSYLWAVTVSSGPTATVRDRRAKEMPWVSKSFDPWNLDSPIAWRRRADGSVLSSEHRGSMFQSSLCLAACSGEGHRADIALRCPRPRAAGGKGRLATNPRSAPARRGDAEARRPHQTNTHSIFEQDQPSRRQVHGDIVADAQARLTRLSVHHTGPQSLTAGTQQVLGFSAVVNKVFDPCGQTIRINVDRIQYNF